MSPSRKRQFDVTGFLDSPELTGRVVDYLGGATIFAQGEASETVLYIQQGSVRLSVISRAGKEAVLGVMGRGDFIGEGALTGQPVRLTTAIAMTPSRIRVIEKAQMIQLLHREHGFSDHFIAYVLTRAARLEADLVDQLFNASEKRLARMLLLLARYGKSDGPRRVLPKVSQEVLAEMVGTTRSRVNFFMNKFRKMGFIEYNGELKVHHALLSVVLHEAPPSER